MLVAGDSPVTMVTTQENSIESNCCNIHPFFACGVHKPVDLCVTQVMSTSLMSVISFSYLISRPLKLFCDQIWGI